MNDQQHAQWVLLGTAEWRRRLEARGELLTIGGAEVRFSWPVDRVREIEQRSTREGKGDRRRGDVSTELALATVFGPSLRHTSSASYLAHIHQRFAADGLLAACPNWPIHTVGFVDDAMDAVRSRLDARALQLKQFADSRRRVLRVQPAGPPSIPERASEIELNVAAIASATRAANMLRRHSRADERAVRVAVLDTGCGPEARQYPVVRAIDLLDDDLHKDSLVDRDGHGTLVCMAIGEVAREGVEIYSIRVQEGAGAHGTLSDLLTGIRCAIQEFRADIVNISARVEIGTRHRTRCRNCGSMKDADALWHGTDQLLTMELGWCTRAALVLAAAGNSPGHVAYPAAVPGVLAVGASSSLIPESYSASRKKGETVGFAPGGTEADPVGTGSRTPGYGTSFACAVASGIAARQLQTFPCGRPWVPPIPALLERMFRCGLPMMSQPHEARSVVPWLSPVWPPWFDNSPECARWCVGHRKGCDASSIRRGEEL